MRTLENWIHFIVLAVSLILSIGGVWGCTFWWNRPLDGGRGGAIAVAVSLIALFANRPYGERIFKFLTSGRDDFWDRLRQLRGDAPLQEVDRVETLAKRVDTLKRDIEALVFRLDIEAAGQWKQNVVMAISAGVGTIAWGFGDIAASFLQDHFLNKA